jgi:hypothetical protein
MHPDGVHVSLGEGAGIYCRYHLPMSSTLRVPFGLKDGTLYEPHQVPNGKACGCVCPACARPLWAKQGAKTAHFAHAQGADCARGLESAVHLAVKQIISTRMQLRLPALFWRNPYTPQHSAALVLEQALCSAQEVRMELPVADFKPDLLVTVDGTVYLVEVAVTHFVDALKLGKIERAQLPTFEIDVAQLKGHFTMERLEQVLFTDPHYPAQWKYHPQWEPLHAKARQEHAYQLALQERQKQERVKHFERYKALPAEGKLQVNLRALGLSAQQMQALTCFVPWEDSFGTERLVWQSAVLAYIAKVQQEQGWAQYLPCTVHCGACLSWMQLVFEIRPRAPDGENIALWRYFKYLESIGLLRTLAHHEFDILLKRPQWSFLAQQCASKGSTTPKQKTG